MADGASPFEPLDEGKPCSLCHGPLSTITLVRIRSFIIVAPAILLVVVWPQLERSFAANQSKLHSLVHWACLRGPHLANYRAHQSDSPPNCTAWCSRKRTWLRRCDCCDRRVILAYSQLIFLINQRLPFEIKRDQTRIVQARFGQP